MRVTAPAKINLHLRVGARRADGFHPLLSWMCTVGLFDTLEISARDKKRGESIVELKCDDPNLPTDSRNLVVRAAEALAQFGIAGGGHREGPASAPMRSASADATIAPATITPVTITLHKKIPSGGGLGGGSSDAAFTLLSLAKFWNLNISTEQLRTIAANLGSDVPFFLFGPSSVCTGRGEIVEPIAPPKPKACVLILPPISCSTPEVYRRFDSLNPQGSNLGPQPWRDWSQLPSDQLLPKLTNDLERPAYEMRPDLRTFRDAAEKLLNRPIRMSGSGSTLFTLFDDDDSAKSAAAKIERDLHVPAQFAVLAPSRQE